MKRLLIIFSLLVPALLQAQVNFVRNGSFEQYSSCPTAIDQIKKALFWQTIDSTASATSCAPEYCNTCADAGSTGVGIPQGGGFNHYPRTGNGLVQSNMYFDSSYSGEPTQRNYTQGHLYSQLIAGTSYCVTFYVSLGQFSQYANNHIGAYLDDGKLDSGQSYSNCGLPKPIINPQILETAVINDTLNWVKVQGSFVANGTEKFITIGNFSDAAHTDTVLLYYPYSSGQCSYYIIDDVSVIESSAIADAGNDMHCGVGDTIKIGTNEEGMPCTWYALGDTTPIGYSGGIKIHPTATGIYKYVVKLDLCGHVTYDTMTLTVWPAGVENWHLNSNSLQLYPNPATKELTIEGAGNCEVSFYDVTGRVMFVKPILTDKDALDIATLPAGLYFVQVIDKANGEKVTRKVYKE